jgi:hypothetical protein
MDNNGVKRFITAPEVVRVRIHEGVVAVGAANSAVDSAARHWEIRGMQHHHASFAVLLTLACGCATTGDTLSGEAAAPPSGHTQAKPDDPWGERTLDELEARLLGAKRGEVEFEIQSQGAVAAHLEGTLRWEKGGVMTLQASGEFDGEAQVLELRVDGEKLEVVRAGQVVHAGERPAALEEAVVVGFVRQGLLHNLALMVAGVPPEHGGGGIGEWLRAVEVQLGPEEVFGGERARPLEFQIEVNGANVGEATVWLREDGLPLERRQVVRLEGGEMGVVERYQGVRLE